MARVDIIERADALKALEEVPDSFVSMLLTDPPYSSGGLFRSDRSPATSDKYQTSDAQKKPEFFGDNRDERSFVKWSVMWMSECFRCMHDGANAIVFSDWRQIANTADAMQIAGFVYRGLIPWRKTINVRPQPNSFKNECEYALWFSRGQIDRHPTVDAKYLAGAYAMPGPYGEDRIHSTQKPLELIKQLMAISPEGCTVLDPFMGSGTTAVAAVETGRHFIGFEMSAEYCAIANERVRSARSNLRGGGSLNG